MSALGVFLTPEDKEVKLKYPDEQGVWSFDEDDYLLYALLCDPVYHAELLWDNPSNRAYGGAYVVWDYQYPLFRADDNYAGFTCGRSVGKTESIKARASSHLIRRIRQNLLLTAPELIHLLPLTDAIESKIRSVRILQEFLDTEAGRTGFTHRPFGCKVADGTEIVGRIPRLSGTGVKGQHQPDLIVDEGQDYPEKGWIEVHETVMKDTVDADGNPDFHYHFYGVHTGDRSSGFHKRAAEGGFRIVQVTALQRPGWSKEEKAAAKAAYGGTDAADYRRNILGEPGSAASPLFVTARLMGCVDQWRDPKTGEMSAYNQHGYVHQKIRVEQFDEMMLPMAEVLDLPSGLKAVWGGMDLGLTNSPTVITLWSEEKVKNETRLKLVRRIHLERMRTKQIRAAVYAILWHFGPGVLKGFGLDETGLGFPIWQEMEDDEFAPPFLKEVCRGWFFNSKVPVHVDKRFVTDDGAGNLHDQYGAAVKEEVDPFTGETRYITFQPMIEASTRYLRAWVDSGELMLPFDPEIIADMQGETPQRLKRIAGLKSKPNAFHILDSMRAMAMMRHVEEIDAALALDTPGDVLDRAL